MLEGVMKETTLVGRSSPLGATVVDCGVNFSLFSRTATAVELLFFDREDDGTPSGVVRIDPATNRTCYDWHVFVPGVKSGQLYGYRVEGRSAPERGLRFDSTRVLLEVKRGGAGSTRAFVRRLSPGKRHRRFMTTSIEPRPARW
jgi:isoamylase